MRRAAYIASAALLITAMLCGCAEKETGKTDGGIVIELDEKQRTTEKYSRMYDEFRDELEVSDEYGTLLPFIGGFHESDVPEMCFDKYGLCTETGKIAVDPVFLSCSVINSGGEEFYLMAYAPENPDEYDIYGNYKSVILKSDGSWKMELEENTWASVFAAEKRIIISEYGEDGVNGMRLCDFDGNVLREEDNVGIAGAVSNGLIHFNAVDADGNSVNNYYTDFDGNVVVTANEYEDTGNFNDGLARARDRETGLWGYIDKTGQYAVAPVYGDVSDFDRGYAVVNTDGTTIVDKTGKEVLTEYYGRAFLPGIDGVFTVGYDSFYNISDGEPVKCPICGAEATDGAVTMCWTDYSDYSNTDEPCLCHGECEGGSCLFLPGRDGEMVDREKVLLAERCPFSIDKEGNMTERNDEIYQDTIEQTAYEYPLGDGYHVFFSYFGNEMQGGTVSYYVCGENGGAVKYHTMDRFDMLGRQKIGTQYYYLFKQDGYSGVKDKNFNDIVRIKIDK